MELHRYDIIEAELAYGTGSIQKKRRPYIIVSNEKGTANASIITVMPLTHIIKKATSPGSWMFAGRIRNWFVNVFNDLR